MCSLVHNLPQLYQKKKKKDKKLDYNTFWDMLGHKGSISCSLQIWGKKSGFEGVFESVLPCHAERDVISLQMQPSKDASPHLGHSKCQTSGLLNVCTCRLTHPLCLSLWGCPITHTWSRTWCLCSAQLSVEKMGQVVCNFLKNIAK